MRARLDAIAETAAHVDPPMRLHPAATRAAALAGVFPAVEHILVDDPAAIPETRAAFADAAVSYLPAADWPVDLDALVDEALSPSVALAGGGRVHVEPTRAAVLVDVDSGTPETGSPERTALAVDLAAAEEIARQIRLRNLAGAVVVDFVGLDDRGARERVRTTLVRALAADPLEPQCLGWTRLGHFELVRRRRARPLAEVLLEPAPGGVLVKTAATIAHQALRALRREARAQPAHRWRLTSPPMSPRRSAARPPTHCAPSRSGLAGPSSSPSMPASAATGSKSLRSDYIPKIMDDSPILPPRPCPICGKPATARHRPFCSARCAQIDLGRWLKGNYRIETDEPPDDGGDER